MVRIKDVAERVGVSTTTVSNVIHGKEQRVSMDVRNRIKEALDEMGYVPNMPAMMLAQTNSGIIGVVIPQKEGFKVTLEDPYFSLLVGNLDYEIKKNNMHMYLIAEQTEEEVLKQASAWNMDGLIICNYLEADLLSLHEKYRKGIVSIDCYLNRKSNFINIMTDDFDGGYRMGKYLVSRGHQKIAMLADNDLTIDHYRWMGFKKALQESGIDVKEEDHIIFSSNEAVRMLELEILLPRLKNYTALFLASDFYALEMSSFLQSKMVRVPDEISVAGFDDLIYAKLGRPKLTTISQNVGKKAEMAVKALLSFQKEERVNRSYVLDVKLVERDSVAEFVHNTQNDRR